MFLYLNSHEVYKKLCCKGILKLTYRAVDMAHMHVGCIQLDVLCHKNVYVLCHVMCSF